MRTLKWDDGWRWDDPNVRWGDPSYALEPGDPGYVDPNPQPPSKPKKKARKYMATNPTPKRYDELLASGEDLADGATQHAVAIGLAQNTEAKIRADLGAMATARGLFTAAESAEAPAYSALRTADSNSKGFIAAAVNSFKGTLGTQWSAYGNSEFDWRSFQRERPSPGSRRHYYPRGRSRHRWQPG